MEFLGQQYGEIARMPADRRRRFCEERDHIEKIRKKRLEK